MFFCWFGKWPTQLIKLGCSVVVMLCKLLPVVFVGLFYYEWNTQITLGYLKHVWLFSTPKYGLPIEENVCFLSLFIIFTVFSLTLINVNLNLNYLYFFYHLILSWVYLILFFILGSCLLVLFSSDSLSNLYNSECTCLYRVFWTYLMS